MTWAVVAIGVGAAAGIGSGLIGADASRSAANTQADASRYSADLQNQRWLQMMQFMQPYMNSGNTALSELQLGTMNVAPPNPAGPMNTGYTLPGAPPVIGQFNPAGQPQGQPQPAPQPQVQPQPHPAAGPPSQSSIQQALQATGQRQPGQSPEQWIQSRLAAETQGMAGLQHPAAPAAVASPQQTPGQNPLIPGALQGFPGFGQPGVPGGVPGAPAGGPHASSPLPPSMGGAPGAVNSLPTNTGASPPLNQGSLLNPFTLQNFQQSPDYQFNLQQGQQAIDKAAAARGNFYAPQTLQDMTKFSQGLASNEWGNAYNQYNNNQNNVWSRLFGLTQLGQSAAAGVGSAGISSGQSIGNTLVGGANAQAAGTIGQANAIAGGAQSAYDNYLMGQILSSRRQQQTSPYDP